MASSGVRWKITAQREDFQALPTGGAAQGVVVTFETGSGLVGSVFVPNTDYTPQKVAALVGQRAATMEAVHGLSEG